MSVRNIILIVAAIFITVGTGILARNWLESQRPKEVAAPPPPKVEGAMVLVAATDLPAGTLLQDKHLRWQAWPTKSVAETYLVKLEVEGAPDPIQDVVGAVVRKGISAGEPLAKGQYLKPGERGFLAAVLRPGYRAMSIPVNPTSGIAGLVFPGDRVDLLLTHTVKRGGADRRVTETVLTNLRVLAIDQTTNDQGGSPKLFKNATVEITPKQAEMLAVVGELGRLTLSLRSLAKDDKELEQLLTSDEPLAEPDPARGLTHTWDTEVSRLLWSPRTTSANTDTVQVSRGNETQELKFPKRKK